MKRRDALKGIGLSLGYIIATPAAISLLQSCSQKPQLNFKPVFFNKEEANIMQKLTDLILPKTDKYPGAAELGIPQFIDAYFNKVANKELQDLIKQSLSAVRPILKSSSDDEYHNLLSKYLKATPEEKDLFKKNKKDTLIYNLLSDLRKTVVWAYKNTEKVGEEILAYDPIPGKYEGCITLKEATGGKAWSL